MSENYQIDGSELRFATGNTVTFDYPVLEVVEFPSSMVVVLNVPPKVNYPLNVFGLTQNGKILWRITSLPRVGASPYVGLIRRSEDRVRLANWDGMLVDVNPVDGTVLAEEWGK